MPLTSYAFRNDDRLQACLRQDTAHVAPGARGLHVRRIQAALRLLDDAVIDKHELGSDSYGKSTAQAVLNYKRKRQIIARSRQSQADDIVGKMTIEAMDKELLTATLWARSTAGRCGCGNTTQLALNYRPRAYPGEQLLTAAELRGLGDTIA